MVFAMYIMPPESIAVAFFMNHSNQ
jgi:hypothetical protein